MTYKEFLTILLNYKNYQHKISELHDLGFNFFDGKYELMMNVEKIFNSSMGLVYNEDGISWINWFIYENEYGEKDWSKVPTFENGELVESDPLKSYGAKDEKGNPIAYSYESLFEMLENEYKNK